MSETSVVERLAMRWCDESYPNPHTEACQSAALHDARWWMEAIAAEIEAEGKRITARYGYAAWESATNEIARFLRTAATPEESRE